MQKSHLTLLLLSLSLAAAVCGSTAAVTVAHAEDDPPTENGPVTKTLIDYFGHDVELSVEYWNGTYYLADYERNIFIHNGSTVMNEMEMHQDPDKFPVYSSQDGKFNDRMAVSIYYNVVKAYDFYCEKNIGFDWKGVNGKNDDIRSNSSSRLGVELPIHVFVHMNAGPYIYNAAYSHQPGFNHCIIFAGDGSERNSSMNMQHQGAALDVIAHEYQHGVTDFFSKGLVYDGESGALNEAFSDMLGLIIEGREKGLSPDKKEFWIVGEDAVSNYGKYLRSIYEPDNGFRATYSNRYVCRRHYNGAHDSSCDYNGVHYNSTIVTHVQYLACQNLPGYFTYDRLTDLWLTTLKSLPKNALFEDFVKCYRSAAADLGFSPAAQKAIHDALKVCGFKDYFKVVFQNEDGTVLGTSYVAEGETANAPAKPQKAHDDKYRYEFDKWDKEFSNITEDTVVIASYKPIEIYVLRFLDGEGNLFEEQIVDVGKNAIKPQSTPTKSAIPGKRYVFEDWDFDFNKVDKSTDVLPRFREINVYTVKFLDGDGSVIDEQQVDEGSSAQAPKTVPVKETDDVGRYTFREWKTPFDNVQGDLEVEPLFDIVYLYKIQFVDSEGNPLSEEYIVEAGDSVEAPESPHKASDKQYTYEFKGWDGEYNNIQKSAIIKPIYESKARQYSVVYYEDEKIINADDSYALYGSAIRELSKGYDGWYTDRDCTKKFEENTVTGHLVLYSKKKGNPGLFIGLGVGAGVLLIAGAVTLVVLKTKKGSKENSDRED